MSEPKIEWSGELSLADLGREAVKHLTQEEIERPDPAPEAPTSIPVPRPAVLITRIGTTVQGAPVLKAEMLDSVGGSGPMTVRAPDLHGCLARLRFAIADHLANSSRMEWKFAKNYVKGIDFQVVQQ